MSRGIAAVQRGRIQSNPGVTASGSSWTIGNVEAPSYMRAKEISPHRP